MQAEETRSAREKDKADKEQKQKEKKQAIAEAMLQTTKRQTEVFDALLGAVSSLVEQNNIVVRSTEFVSSLPLTCRHSIEML